MSADDHELATQAWRDAEQLASANSDDKPGSASTDEEADIREHMKNFMLHKLKWTHKELHDAVVLAGISPPQTPSPVNYLPRFTTSLAMTK